MPRASGHGEGCESLPDSQATSQLARVEQRKAHDAYVMN